MYKILLIDDEKSIVKGLAETLNREELELQIYQAWTVSKGLEIAKEVKLDMVCSDINMPVMDGFAFVKEVLGYWKECKVVFLTGYDTFDYIYKAIHEFGARYILKNEEDKFLDMIKKCIEEVEADQQAKLGQAKMLRLMDENRENSKRQIWQDYLRGGGTDVNFVPLKEEWKREQIIWEQTVMIAMGKMIQWEDLGVSEKKLFQVVGQIKEEYQYFYAMDCIRVNHNSYLLIAQKKEDRAPNMEEVLTGLQTELLELEGERVSFFYSEKEVGIDQLREQVTLFSMFLSIKLLKSNPVLISIEEMLDENTGSSAGRKQCALQVDKMLMEKKFIELADVFLSLYLSIRQTHRRSLTDTRMYYTCIGKVASYIEKHVKYADMPEELQKSYYHLRYMTGIDEIHDFVIRFLQYMGASQEELEGGEDSWAVQKVEAYIRNHIAEEITLNTLAKLVHFNPSYLSRFYKAATGKTISTFIREAKIMKAKEFLKHSDKKIGDISKLLGFESVGYFTVFFKKQEGVTPKEYRNQQ